MRNRYAAGFVGLLLFGGCSDRTRPSDADLRNAIELQINEEFPAGAIRIESIERLNGFSREDNVYVADLKISLVFLKSSEQLIDSAKQRVDDAGTLGAGLQAAALRLALGDFDAGHTITRERETTLIRTEKGWRIDAGAS